MATLETTTLSVTIDAPFERVVADLADPTSHPEWATEFFAGPARPVSTTEAEVDVPMMGGPARLRVDADRGRGVVDVALAPGGGDYGPPIPVRVVRNGDGVDVLWTLARTPGIPDAAWEQGVAAMRRELEALRARHE